MSFNFNIAIFHQLTVFNYFCVGVAFFFYLSKYYFQCLDYFVNYIFKLENKTKQKKSICFEYLQHKILLILSDISPLSSLTYFNICCFCNYCFLNNNLQTLYKIMWSYLSHIFKCESKGTFIIPSLLSRKHIINKYVLKIYGQRNAR